MQIFVWDDENKLHIAKHNVTPEETKEVVFGAMRPFPTYKGDGKWVVLGPTRSGRFLQVIFIYRRVEDVDHDMIDPNDLLLIQDEERVLYVIHARPLTEHERHTARRKRR